MPNRLVKWLLMATVCWGGVKLLGAEVPGPARVLKHTAANGETCFAVILKAGELPKGGIVREHVILIDTSASQVGEHRQQSIGVLVSLLKSLPDGDRVRLFAADLRAEPLDDGFHDVHSPEVAESVELLKARVPLGATNLEGVLRTAMQSVTDRPIDITYIGDGMSTADLVEVPELRTLVSDLRQRQMRVHSFGVGPQRNLQILSILAHQTGGFVAFDAPIVETSPEKATKAEKTKSAKLAKDIARTHRTAAESAVEQGKTLAAALNSPVFFATELQVTPAGTSLLPMTALPIRADRETIYLARGTLPASTRIVLIDAAGETLEWKLAAHVDQPGATILPVMIGQLEVTQGLTNSLAGTILFNLAQSDFSDNVTAMAEHGVQMLQLGDIEQATKISAMVSEADPNNDSGKLLRKAIERLKERPVKGTSNAGPAKPGLGAKPRLAPIPEKGAKQ